MSERQTSSDPAEIARAARHWKTKYDEAWAELAKVRAEVVAAQDRETAQLERIRTLEAKSRPLEERVDELRRERDRLRRTIDDMSKDVASMDQRNAALEDVNADLKAQLERALEALEADRKPAPDPDPPLTGSKLDALGRSFAQNSTQWFDAKLADRASQPVRKLMRGPKLFKPGTWSPFRNQAWTTPHSACIAAGHNGYDRDTDAAADPLEDVPDWVVENCSFGGGEPGDRPKWGQRCWQLGNVRIVDSDYSNIYSEHGIYDSANGDVMIDGCTFEDIGGHPVYYAGRPMRKLINRNDASGGRYPVGNLPFEWKATYTISDCHSRRSNLHASRSSNVYEMFNWGSLRFPGTVIVRGCSITENWARARHETTNEWVDADSERAQERRFIRAPGAMVLTHYPDMEVPGESQVDRRDGMPGLARHQVERFVWDDNLIDLGRGNKAVMSLQGVKDYVFRDSAFITRDGHRAPQIRIDEDCYVGDKQVTHEPCDSVLFENCGTQDCVLRVYEPGGWQDVDVHCPGGWVRITRGANSKRAVVARGEGAYPGSQEWEAA